MHDLVHDLAQSIMREEISTNVPEDATTSTKGYRYFSIVEQPKKPLPKRVFKNARDIYFAKGRDIIFGEALKNSKRLRSVTVDFNWSKASVTPIAQVKNLKYLEMIGLQCKSLPEAISDIWSLQALYLTSSYLLELPRSIGKLQKLRTLHLSSCEVLKCLPDSIGDCHMLSSIALCDCIQLRTLPNTFSKLQKLRTLNLSGCGSLKCLPDSIGDCNMLSSIDCRSCMNLTALPNSIGRNEMLRVLRLCFTAIKKLPSNITTLRNLECLVLSKCWNLVELPEGIGNLKKLKVLNLDNCNRLELSEDIVHLKKLQVLTLNDCRNLVELPEGINKLEKLQVLKLNGCEELRGMPVGIGQLSRLGKLSLFVVGEGEKFARISELVNLGMDSEGLIIRGIKHVLEQDDAHKACLKRKNNLQSLKLEWEGYHKGEVNTELEEDVIDGLEPPPGIKKLEISGYSGRKYARWMQNQVGGEAKGLAYFQFLRVMKLYYFLKLKHLDGLVELPCLEELVLQNMPSLESISGGPFPLLATLRMEDLHSLGEVWIVAERSMSDGEEGGSCSNRAHHLGQVQVGNCLTFLNMIQCPKLKMKTFLPLSGHLTHWELFREMDDLSRSNSFFSCHSLSRDGLDWVRTQSVPALESLDILLSDALTEVPESMGCIASLQSLDLARFSNIRKLPECIGALGSLQKLSIQNCINLSSLPQSMGHLISLQKLKIAGCPALHQLPECLGELSSLRTLHLQDLGNIKSFPESLQHVTSLQYLTIAGGITFHELPGGLGDLRSLCKLKINQFLSVTCFPESMRRLTSLKKLCVHYCPNLTSLPQWMEDLSSLENLRISCCRRIESLPEGIKHLTALKVLEINCCPDLATRCKRGDSWALFTQSFGVAMNGLDSEFLEVGREIVNKCGGIPLAIKVLAGVLREKRMIEEWKDMRDSNLLDVEDKEHRVSACLRLSYFHLPSHLKQCFTMCSLFPKGHRIYKEQLFDLWIAHDMISLTPGVDYLEDIGDEHFNSLVQVSFLQDVDEEYGRVICKMHDLVHDLARSIMSEEISTNVPEDAASSTKGYRYFCLTERPRKSLPKRVLKNARAMYLENSRAIMFSEALKNAKHLRSIIVNFNCSAAVLVPIIQIKNLKYIEIYGLHSESLPEAISDIWSLQAVHLINSGLLELPKSIFKLQKLRILNLSGCWQLKCLPDSIGDCNMLSSIVLCKCIRFTDLPKSVGKLQKLRMLNLSHCEELKCLPESISDCNMLSSIILCQCIRLTDLPKSVGKLQELRMLNLSHCRGLNCLPDSIGDCNTLSSIDLSDCKNLAALTNCIARNENLRVLRLGDSELKKLPSSIKALRNLECLDLYNCSRLVELPEGIGNLEKLQVLNLKYCLQLVKLPKGISKLERLQVLNLEYCSDLRELPEGIINLERLQVLSLEGCTNLVELPEGICELDKLQTLNLNHCEALRGMPAGIGQLSRQEKLSLFVVGEGEKFAGISELANIGMDSEGLIIRGIEHVLEQNDAHKACLKWKKNLQSLKLEWGRHYKGEVKTELEEAILDGLEPPPGIKELQINGYSGRKYARWMQDHVGGEVKGLAYFQFLRVMKLSNFLKLKHLDGLVELPCLEELQLNKMPSLESISGGLFPSLVKLEMRELHSLEDVWMVAERTMSYGEEGGSCSNLSHHLGQVQVGNNLTYLAIIGCPKLKLKTSLPLSGHLTQWELIMSSPTFGYSIRRRDGLDWVLRLDVPALESLDILFSDVRTEVPESLGSLASLRPFELPCCSEFRKLSKCLWVLGSLQKLSILNCDNLSSLPQSMGHLTSLQELQIHDCPALDQLPECLGELCSLQTLHLGFLPNIKILPQSLQHLISLLDLSIEWCPALHELPECLGDFCSLQKLKISKLPRLACLPESMCQLTSLKKLHIEACPGLTSLPQRIEGLSSLENLSIIGCPRFKSLPEGIRGLTALKELEIDHCAGIKSLPEGIKGLTSLKKLKIHWCPDLARRCEREKGEDWHLISHIPLVGIRQY